MADPGPEVIAGGPSLSSRAASSTPQLTGTKPGNWAQSTLVFSQGRMVRNGVDDEFIQLGWVALDASKTQRACGVNGPAATKTYYAWKHGSYPPGSCQDDKKDGINFARWDHAVLRNVDGCPTKDKFVEYGQVATRPFLSNCDAHVTSGFGNPARRKPVLNGNYVYDAAARTLALQFEVNGGCRREYYRDLVLDAGKTLLSLRLDGAKSSDVHAPLEGNGATHGYAYLSPRPISYAASFSQSMQTLRDSALPGKPQSDWFLADGWRFREARGAGQPERQYRNDQVTIQPEFCKTGVYSNHTCGGAGPGEPPYLAKCAAAGAAKTAYLQWYINPFPNTPREQLYWAWHAHKAKSWNGCYHRGSHANPLLQVVDANGTFRGFVGVEMQRSASTEEKPADSGRFQVPADSFKQTDYRVWRWIQNGYDEPAP